MRRLALVLQVFADVLNEAVAVCSDQAERLPELEKGVRNLLTAVQDRHLRLELQFLRESPCPPQYADEIRDAVRKIEGGLSRALTRAAEREHSRYR